MTMQRESCRKAERNAWLTVGNTCTDVAIAPEKVEFVPGAVRFLVEGVWYTIAYDGPPITWGDKRIAAAALTWVTRLPNVKAVPGGGAWCTGVQLAAMLRKRRALQEVLLVDAAAGTGESAGSYRRFGIDYLPLGIETAPVNLIIARSGGAANRIILKSPTVPGLLPFRRRRALIRELAQRAGVVLINSAKSRALTAAAVSITRQAGAMQFSVLTESLPPEDRLELLLAYDTSSVCNLQEFAPLATTLGVEGILDDETTVSIPELAEAMGRFARRVRCGDVVVTLGARGSVILDRRSRSVFHVALQNSVAPLVLELLREHPERVNGAGDRFFAAFSFYRASEICQGTRSPAAEAARLGSLAGVRRLCPEVELGREDLLVDRVIKLSALEMAPERGDRSDRSWRDCNAHRLMVA